MTQDTDLHRLLERLRTEFSGDRCVHPGCDALPLGIEDDFYFGMMLTDAGWRVVCAKHWTDAALAGEQVWPPLPGAHDV